MANINKIRVSGTTYDIQDINASKTVELTQAQYDALVDKDPNTFYVITDASAGDLSQYWTSAETQSAITEAVSGKADSSSVYLRIAEDEEVTAAALNNINDRLTEDEEVTAAGLNAINDKFDGLKLKKLTQSQYDALSGNTDSNTLYVIVN